MDYLSVTSVASTSFLSTTSIGLAIPWRILCRYIGVSPKFHGGNRPNHPPIRSPAIVRFVPSLYYILHGQSYVGMPTASIVGFVRNYVLLLGTVGSWTPSPLTLVPYTIIIPQNCGFVKGFFKSF
jgi:hypothetical protein